jgi:hypothetical protein
MTSPAKEAISNFCGKHSFGEQKRKHSFGNLQNLWVKRHINVVLLANIQNGVWETVKMIHRLIMAG